MDFVEETYTLEEKGILFNDSVKELMREKHSQYYKVIVTKKNKRSIRFKVTEELPEIVKAFLRTLNSKQNTIPRKISTCYAVFLLKVSKVPNERKLGKALFKAAKIYIAWANKNGHSNV